ISAGADIDCSCADQCPGRGTFQREGVLAAAVAAPNLCACMPSDSGSVVLDSGPADGGLQPVLWHICRVCPGMAAPSGNGPHECCPSDAVQKDTSGRGIDK